MERPQMCDHLTWIRPMKDSSLTQKRQWADICAAFLRRTYHRPWG